MTNDTTKNEIIAQLVESGMTIEEAEAVYKEQFTSQGGGVRLPFPRIQVNNVAGIADIGVLVADPVKDDDGEIVSYGTIYDFKDVDFLVINRKAMYNVYDAESGKVTVKTKLLDAFTAKSAYTDVLSGASIAQLAEAGVECKYQMLLTVGIRPKASDEAFTTYNMYAKGAMLYGLNQACDQVRDKSPYQLVNATTKISKKGAVRYADIDLDNTEARVLTKTELLKNLTYLMDTNKQFNEYITAINSQYDELLVSSNGQPSEDELPA
jgi:hypothetical protein